MEFPHLGRQCSEESCQQLDFLPFKCEQCEKYYCLNHKDEHSVCLNGKPYLSPASLAAQKTTLPMCPLCQKAVPLTESYPDANSAINRHIERGCKNYPDEAAPSNGRKQVICNYCAKHFDVLLTIECKQCKRRVCLQHRHSHACTSSTQQSSSSSSSSQPLSLSTRKRKRRLKRLVDKRAARNDRTAKAVKSMRAKNRAVGNDRIPYEKRIYCEILFPMSLRKKPRTMFFRKTAKVGVVLDEITTINRIKNNNHKPDAIKLKLYDLKTGLPLKNNTLFTHYVQTPSDAVLLEYDTGDYATMTSGQSCGQSSSTQKQSNSSAPIHVQ